MSSRLVRGPPPSRRRGRTSLLFDGWPSLPPDALTPAVRRYVMRNPFGRVKVPPSGLVTVTLRNPVLAEPDTDSRTVMVFELLRVTETMVMPLPEKATVAP